MIKMKETYFQILLKNLLLFLKLICFSYILVSMIKFKEKF